MLLQYQMASRLLQLRALPQRALFAPMVLAQVQDAKANEKCPASEDDGDDNCLAPAPLGLGLPATVVYRAKAA